MKKKSTSIYQYIDCIHIYRDDIEQIYDILSQAISQPPQVEIDDYIIEDKSDFDKLTMIEKPQSLELNTKNIQVKIDKYHAKVYVNSPDDSITGYIYRIVQILENRKNKTLIFLDKWSTRLSLIPIFFGLLLVFLSEKTNQGLSFLGGSLVVIGFCFSIIGLLITILNLTNTKISLKYKKDQPNFFKRNRDDLIVGLIIGILMLFLGIGIGKFIK
jgi:hypothetical protein